MKTSRNAKLNLCTLQIIMNIYFKFYEDWFNCFGEDCNNKLHQTGAGIDPGIIQREEVY